MFRAPLSGKQKLLVCLPLIIVAVKIPRLWPVLGVVIVATVVTRLVPGYLRQTVAWAAATVIATGVVLTLAGLVLGLFSMFDGLVWRGTVPWGLVWATSGRHDDGITFEFGNGFMLTPLFAGLIVVLARLPFARKVSRTPHSRSTSG